MKKKKKKKKMAYIKMCEKRKNGAKFVCEVLKCIDLNKLQRCNERVSQDEESLERHKHSL